jgi:hypothetical protein
LWSVWYHKSSAGRLQSSFIVLKVCIGKSEPWRVPINAGVSHDYKRQSALQGATLGSLAAREQNNKRLEIYGSKNTINDIEHAFRVSSWHRIVNCETAIKHSLHNIASIVNYDSNKVGLRTFVFCSKDWVCSSMYFIYTTVIGRVIGSRYEH